MITFKRLVSILILYSIPAFCQLPTYFVARTGAVNLSSAGTTATLQQPATVADQITVLYAKIICPAACTVTQTQNATGVTGSSGTAGTVIPVGTVPNVTPLTVTFWTAVTLSGGTVIDADVCNAACTVVVYYPTYLMGNTGINTNLSITISTVTGNAYIEFYGKRTQP